MVAELVAGTLTSERAAIAKMFVTERQWEAIDACVQLFGGAGYMNEYEVARLWRDTRIQRVLAGSNEVMRHIIGRSLKLDGGIALCGAVSPADSRDCGHRLRRTRQ